MSTLRTATLNIAASLPKGDPTRRKLLTVLAAKPLELKKKPGTREPLPDVILDVIQKYRQSAAGKSCAIPRVYTKYEELHPLAGKCRGLSTGLARAIDKAVGEDVARAIGGWFRDTGKDYYFPRNISLYDTSPSPPWEESRGQDWQEHWWVEVLGWYVDVSADQFFPSEPEKQKEHAVVTVPSDSKKYHPHRRRPLKRNVRLSPNLEKLAQKIVSLKRSAGWAKIWHVNQAPHRAITWLKKNGPKYGLTGTQMRDLETTLRHESWGRDFHLEFNDIKDVRFWLGQVA